ncbi:hypothetical protein LTS08_001034 [Lithohypha guttulata]|nr:hypothetical protein LTS08_001034 [Lithohypha guttulata]
MERRKYRISKISLDDRKSFWQPDEGSTLNEILQQERHAWLTASSEQPREEGTAAQKLRSPTSPSYGLEPREEMEWENTPSKQRNTSDTTILPMVDPEDYSSSRQQPKTPRMIIQKSFFKEGSMNEGSRATASTWDEPPLLSRQTSSNPLDTSSLLDESTPRTAASGRPSISSSIDVNEFKPLPVPPSTLKKTIKRFGQKLKHSHSDVDQATVRNTTHAAKSPRKGLRKSVSSWKIFNNPESEYDDTPVKEEEESRRSKNNHIAKTLRFHNRDKVQKKQHDQQQKSVLDDRKRKAEIAYAEQFGTARNKQENDEARQETQSYIYESATVRRQDPSSNQSSQKSSAAQQAQERRELLAQQTVEALMSTMAPSSNVPDASSRHSRSTSVDSVGRFESDADRTKRTSRSKLEKENQQLRAMLRNQERNHLQRSRSHSRDRSTTSNWQIHTDEKEEDTPALASTKVHNTRQHSSQSAAPSTVRAIAGESSPVPPIPPLPIRSDSRRKLLPTDGNQSRIPEPAKIKRYTQSRRNSRAIELPRPLSIVIEGAESEGEGQDNTAACKSTKTRTPVGGSPQKSRQSYDGADDSKENDVHAQATSEKEKWDWPEDVF